MFLNVFKQSSQQGVLLVRFSTLSITRLHAKDLPTISLAKNKRDWFLNRISNYIRSNRPKKQTLAVATRQSTLREMRSPVVDAFRDHMEAK